MLIMLYTEDLCIVRLSSTGMQQSLLQCDDCCTKHSATFNVTNM